MRTVAVIAFAALALAPAAAAKEPVSATACGASGCRTVTDRATLREIPGGEAIRPLGAPSPYYALEIVGVGPGGETHTFSVYYVPAERALAWVEHGTTALHPYFGEKPAVALRALTRDLEPFPAPRDAASASRSPWAGRALPARRERSRGWLVAFALVGAVTLAGVPLARRG